MANISSGANGPWSSTATWTGGVVPGVGDNVTIAGHVVTLDQTVEINNLTNTGNGYIEVTGSTPQSFTAAGTVTVQSTSTAAQLIQFSGSYTAVDSSITLETVTVGAFVGVNMWGIIAAAVGAGGSALISVGTFNGDTNATQRQPALVYWYNTSTTGVELTIQSALNRNSNILSSLTGSDPSKIVLNTGASFNYAQQIAAVASISLASVDLIVNASGPIQVTSSSTFAYTTNSGGAIVINGDVSILDGISTVYLSTAPRLIINGNITRTANASAKIQQAIATGYSVTINGSITDSATRTNVSELIGVNVPTYTGSITVTGDLILHTTPLSVAGSTVTIGAGDGRLHTVRIGARGVTLGGILSLDERDKYKFIIYGSPDIDMNEQGAGPLSTDIRSGASTSFGYKGAVSMPEKGSVRAGIPVSTETGTALLDVKDLASVTGGQIATLSE